MNCIPFKNLLQTYTIDYQTLAHNGNILLYTKITKSVPYKIIKKHNMIGLNYVVYLKNKR